MSPKSAGAMLLFLVAALIATYIIPAQFKKTAATQPPDIKTEIPALMQEQSTAWNRGDLDGFMSLYLQADTLLFLSTRNSYYGWQTLYDSYNKNYWADGKNRGELRFEIEKVQPIDDRLTSCLAHGRWNVALQDTTLGGKFSLIFKYFDKIGWKIIADHTW